MAGLSDTVARMARLRKQFAQQAAPAGPSLLEDFGEFGPNPGALKAWTYVPDQLPAGAPLIVVLHGCTQTASSYDRGSGWSQLADRHGFALLFPEQQRANNPNLCFNWFTPQDSGRGQGEARSIRDMVGAVQRAHGTDPARVFVTGLSAGGAMTSVMLAAYPEVFAGGAIIAGLPFGVASSVPQAFEQMRGGGVPDAKALAAKVRSETGYKGSWPIVSVWHGGADATVNVSNARAIVEQWRVVHGAPVKPDQSTTVDNVPRRSWRDAAGREVIEEYIVAGMGHGTPLDPTAEGGCGASGAYMLDVGISSSYHICRFWGLIGDEAKPKVNAADVRVNPTLERVQSPRPQARKADPEPQPRSGQADVQKVIEDALRSAGLMR